MVLLVTLACSSARPPRDIQSGEQGPEEGISKALQEEAVRVLQGLWVVRKKVLSERGDVFTQRLRLEPMFKKATRASLEARAYDFFFSTPEGPSRAATVLLEAIKDVRAHGLSEENYPIAKIEEGFEAVRRAAARLVEGSPKDPLFEALFGLLQREEPPTLEAVLGLAMAGRLRGLDQKALVAFERAARDRIEAEETLYKERVNLEVACSVAFFRYALDMKFLKVASPFKAEREKEKADIKYLDGLLKAFEAFAKDPKEGLLALLPSHPYYEGLKEGLKRYRKIAEEGGFVKVPQVDMGLGTKGKAVVALKKRLAQEGYFEGDVEDPVFGEDLMEAVKEYQGTHGFEPTGRVEAKHIKSLNVPVEYRIKQIELGLQRLRESDVRHFEPLYVRVNIPEFKMEVWEDGKLVMKHKVVVGNNNWDKDPDALIEGRINRTKIFEAAISQIVLNPRWYVPARIRRLEIEYEILEEPDYFARRKFNVKLNPDGTEEIYQESGDDNALGRVKFVFPNPYGIFMHDTNQKQFFDREIRAFSHGCIRLQNPLEVAYFLLERRAGMKREKVDRLLASGEVHEIKLDPPVPIFVEYVTVGVDQKGRIEFFSDVYGYDKDYFDGKIPYSEEELKLLMRKIPRID